MIYLHKQFICINGLIRHACPRDCHMSSRVVCVCVEEHCNVTVSRLQSDGEGGASILYTCTDTPSTIYMELNPLYKKSLEDQICVSLSSDSHTLSDRVMSQSACASRSLTMSAWPCSPAHISAVEPSSS